MAIYLYSDLLSAVTLLYWLIAISAAIKMLNLGLCILQLVLFFSFVGVFWFCSGLYI